MNITIEIQPSFSSRITINLSPSLSKKTLFELSYREGYFKDFSPESFSVKKLTKKEWDALTEDLRGEVEVIPKFAMGLDGCTYTVKINNGFNEYKYTIWSPNFDTRKNPLCYFINKVLMKINKTEYLI